MQLGAGVPGPEAARACLELGFSGLQLEEIISFTAVKNSRSIRVMEKIGMERDRAHDFDHPNVSPGHALRPHVLYRLRRDKWNAWHLKMERHGIGADRHLADQFEYLSAQYYGCMGPVRLVGRWRVISAKIAR